MRSLDGLLFVKAAIEAIGDFVRALAAVDNSIHNPLEALITDDPIEKIVLESVLEQIEDLFAGLFAPMFLENAGRTGVIDELVDTCSESIDIFAIGSLNTKTRYLPSGGSVLVDLHHLGQLTDQFL